MHDQQELQTKIVELYPDIDEHGIKVDVNFDKEKKTWVVNLKKGDQVLQHYLEIADADDCMEGRQCVSLGLEIAQLLKNIEGKQY